MKPTIFERYPKITLLGVTLFLALLVIVTVEFTASAFFGLGKPILYQAHPLFGYRPLPSQTVARKPSCVIKINNLGLRAQSDWDREDFYQKILFIGDSVTYGGSYISNEDLFSELALKDLSPYQGGNAAVNGWGVDNVHSFIIETEFLPAKIFVSVFPEGDFYRGLTRIGGQPFWTRQPKFALEELLQYWIYQIHLLKTPFKADISQSENNKIVAVAVRHLKDLDEYLQNNDRWHIIYITPSRSELLGMTHRDKAVESALIKAQLPVIYLEDRIKALNLSHQEIKALYHDEIHLSKMGHILWAQIIAHDLKAVIQTQEKASQLVKRDKKNDQLFPSMAS